MTKTCLLSDADKLVEMYIEIGRLNCQISEAMRQMDTATARHLVAVTADKIRAAREFRAKLEN